MAQVSVAASRKGAQVPSSLRNEIMQFVSDGEGSRDRLKELIARCRAYEDCQSVLSKARRVCHPRGHALAKELDEAIRAWQPPQELAAPRQFGDKSLDVVSNDSLKKLTTEELRNLALDRGILGAESMGRVSLLSRLRGRSVLYSCLLTGFFPLVLAWRLSVALVSIIQKIARRGRRLFKKAEFGSESAIRQIDQRRELGHHEVTMTFWKRLFSAKDPSRTPKTFEEKTNHWDLRSESEIRAEVEARYGLKGEDEQLARKIIYHQKQRGTQDSPNRRPDDPDNNRKEAEAAIRKIGEHLGANGGSERMVRVAYRVKALGGSSRQLEWCWEGICGWLA